MKQEFYIKKYTSEDLSRWNKFANECIQQHFFFQRNFMEYHKDRFEDYSLIIEDQNRNIIALFPASLYNNIITSHAGLTFGGLLYRHKTFVQSVIDLLLSIELYFKEKGIQKLIYKTVPFIYKLEQGEEEAYALFKNNWKLFRRDFSTIVKNNIPYNPDRSRRKNNNIAIKNNVDIKESDDYAVFWNILNQNLLKRHNVAPTHSLEELLLLANRFPHNIKLIGGYKDDEMLGGAVIFLTPNVCKIQYSVNSEKGRVFKVLDAIFTFIIQQNKLDYIDFGHSCEDNGKILNVGLSKFKTQFSGEGLVNDFYEKELS